MMRSVVAGFVAVPPALRRQQSDPTPPLSRVARLRQVRAVLVGST